MLSGDQIRIAELLPCGAEGLNAPLRCNMHIESLSSDPDYEAVSYVWGDQNDTTNIEVAGHEVKISLNLDALLRQLRHPTQSRLIWADQLCIDQSDLTEKNSQVQMMGDIYSKCCQCLMWMGETPKSVSPSIVEDAIHLLEFMAAPDDVPIPSFLASRETFKKVFDILCLIHPHRHTWWSRIWTVQEGILPPTKTILWGSHALPWQLLVQAMRTWTGPWIPGLSEILIHEDYELMNGICANVVWITYGRDFDDPAVTASKWRTRHATDLRDKVFGLRGLIPPETPLEFTDRRNYESSVADVYSSFTLDAIVAKNTLQPLVLNPRLENDIATENIPRWAMDLRGFPRYDADTFYRVWADERYNACNGRSLDVPLLRSTVAEHDGLTNVLGVSGVMVDRVEVVSPFRSEWAQSDTKISQRLQDWYKLAASRRLNKPSVDIELEFDEDFCRLVVADLLEPRKEARRPNEEDLKQIWRFVTEGERDPGEIWEEETHMKSQLFKQAFFVTSSGMVGMGSWETQEDDEVWILDGGNYPFTLRPRSQNDSRSQSDFIACCYVQGIMFGEWLQKEARSTQKIFLH